VAAVSSPSSFLVGLIGAGIGPSLSPRLHEHEADALGLRYHYRRIDLDALGVDAAAAPDLVRAARDLGFDGLNITHPCKQVVLDSLDDLSPDAAVLGAVNTVVLRDGRMSGHNTDWSGFARNLRRGLPDAPLDHVVVLGAGGAGSAVTYALARLGAERVTVIDRDDARAERLVASLQPAFTGRRLDCTEFAKLAPTLSEADGIVHATPTGMAAHPGIAVPVDALVPSLWLADIVYRPLETELVRTARRIGCPTLDGGAMAVFQAADAFELFTGIAPDPERMLAHFADLATEEPSADDQPI
jgi:shikimate dehydrogenase